MFSCDVNKHCQFMLLKNHLPERFYPNVTKRDHAAAPAVDWYGAGFPCQPFSTAGLGLGVNDHKERGLLVASALAYVQAKKPALVMLENVAGIMHQKHLPLLAFVLYTLQEAGYRTFYQVLNTRDFGIPHHRQRLYIVAIRSDALKRNFTWPVPTGSVPLDQFLSSGSTGLPGLGV